MTTIIPTLSPAPTRLMSEEEFSNVGDEFLGGLPPFGVALNAFGAEMNVIGALVQQALDAGLSSAASNANIATEKAELAGVAANEAVAAAISAQDAVESIAMGPVASINGLGGAVVLKTVGGIDLVGVGDIPIGAGDAAVASISADRVLTLASAKVQSIAATAENLSIVLPDATTLPKGGELYVIENTGAYPFAVRDSISTLQTIIQPGQIGASFLTDNSTSAGSWAFGSLRCGELGGVLLGTTISSTVSGWSYSKTVWLTDTTAFIMGGNSTVYYTIATVSGGVIFFSTQGSLTGFANNAASKLIKLTPTLLVHWQGGTMRAISISGTTAALGTAVTVTIGSTGGILRVGDNAFLAYYQSSTNYYTTAQVYTVSGTTIMSAGSYQYSVAGASKILYGAMISDTRAVVPQFTYTNNIWGLLLLNVSSSAVSLNTGLSGISRSSSAAEAVLLGLCKSGPDEFIVMLRDSSNVFAPPVVQVYSCANDALVLKNEFRIPFTVTTDEGPLGMRYVRDGVVLFSFLTNTAFASLCTIHTEGTGSVSAINNLTLITGLTTYGLDFDVNALGQGFVNYSIDSTHRGVNTLEAA